MRSVTSKVFGLSSARIRIAVKLPWIETVASRRAVATARGSSLADDVVPFRARANVRVDRRKRRRNVNGIAIEAGVEADGCRGIPAASALSSAPLSPREAPLGGEPTSLRWKSATRRKVSPTSRRRYVVLRRRRVQRDA